MKFQSKIEQTIVRQRLFAPTDKILVALSGGADSVSLLCVLQDLGYKIEAVHCNFHLRGDESDRDQRFVTQLCQGRDIPLHLFHYDTRAYADSHHLSIEMAARELRYNSFEELRQKLEMQWIAVAHHRDDSVETMLLNLIRGTGLQGLRGIRYINGYVVRPLLDISRAEILSYLKEEGMLFVTDSTNYEIDFTRNRIRLQLLPLMRGINPSIDETLQHTMERLREVSVLYGSAVDEARKRVVMEHEGLALCINREALNKEIAPRTLLFELISAFGFSSAQIMQIADGLEGESGAVYRSKHYELLRDRDTLQVKALEVPTEEITNQTLPAEGHFTLPDGRRLTIVNHPFTTLTDIPHDRTVASLDADKLTAPMTVRLVQRGDRFVPFGMKGSRLVSDYLTDRKFSLFEKASQWVVLCGEEIVWLVGERLDNRFAVSEATKQVKEIRVEE